MSKGKRTPVPDSPVPCFANTVYLVAKQLGFDKKPKLWSKVEAFLEELDRYAFEEEYGGPPTRR